MAAEVDRFAANVKAKAKKEKKSKLFHGKSSSTSAPSLSVDELLVELGPQVPILFFSDIEGLARSLHMEFSKQARSRIYQGFLMGTQVLVKRLLPYPLNMSQDEDVVEEGQILYDLRHGCLIRLVGVVIDNKERAMVYEYVADTLANVLDKHRKGRDRTEGMGARFNFSKEQRMYAILQVASAVTFLHEQQPPILHGAVCAFNVGMVGKRCRLGDFIPQGIGGQPWEAPEVVKTGSRMAESADTYGFGMLLLELVTGQPLENEDGTLLKDTIINIFKDAKDEDPEPKLDALCLPDIQWPIGMVKVLLNVALWCTAATPSKRPSMRACLTKMCELAAVIIPDAIEALPESIWESQDPAPRPPSPKSPTAIASPPFKALASDEAPDSGSKGSKAPPLAINTVLSPSAASGSPLVAPPPDGEEKDRSSLDLSSLDRSGASGSGSGSPRGGSGGKGWFGKAKQKIKSKLERHKSSSISMGEEDMGAGATEDGKMPSPEAATEREGEEGEEGEEEEEAEANVGQVAQDLKNLEVSPLTPPSGVAVAPFKESDMSKGADASKTKPAAPAAKSEPKAPASTTPGGASADSKPSASLAQPVSASVAPPAPAAPAAAPAASQGAAAAAPKDAAAAKARPASAAPLTPAQIAQRAAEKAKAEQEAKEAKRKAAAEAARAATAAKVAAAKKAEQDKAKAKEVGGAAVNSQSAAERAAAAAKRAEKLKQEQEAKEAERKAAAATAREKTLQRVAEAKNRLQARKQQMDEEKEEKEAAAAGIVLPPGGSKLPGRRPSLNSRSVERSTSGSLASTSSSTASPSTKSGGKEGASSATAAHKPTTPPPEDDDDDDEDDDEEDDGNDLFMMPPMEVIADEVKRAKGRVPGDAAGAVAACEAALTALRAAKSAGVSWPVMAKRARGRPGSQLAGEDFTRKVEATPGGEIVGAMIGTMKKHTGSPDLCENVLTTLLPFAGGGPMTELMAEGGAVEGTIGVMMRHSRHESIIAKGCRLLGALSKHDTLRDCAVANGAVGAIMAALDSHRASADVVQAACEALIVMSAHQ